MSNTQIQKASEYSLLIIFVFLALYTYVVSGRVVALERHHAATATAVEAMCGCNPAGSSYVSRLQQVVENGVVGGPTGGVYWGNEPGKSNLVSDEGFYGHGEPPVFYDIGDVRTVRAAQSKNSGYTIDENGQLIDAKGQRVTGERAKRALKKAVGKVKENYASYRGAENFARYRGAENMTDRGLQARAM
jgi:hypothetical protein